MALGLSAFALSSAACSRASFELDPTPIPATYDFTFYEVTARYVPQWSPAWLKAQCWAESRFDPLAVSPAGARGLCQFMPRTWAEVSRALGWRSVSPFHPRSSIRAAGYYMRRMRAGWTAPRPEPDRRRLAIASYNAGFGNILRAQKLCQDPIPWLDIAPCLTLVTGPKNAHETNTYVDQVERFTMRLEAAR